MQVAGGERSTSSRPVTRQSLAAVPALLPPGAVLEGHYEVERRLGEGGMAEVYLAHDRWLNRPVAIKTAHPDFADQLAHEAQVLARFAHPGLVAAHSYGYLGQMPYLVLEYLPGVSLAQKLRASGSGFLPVEEAMGLVTRLCDALLPLHAAGLVHCDLKPSNIMCAPPRVVLIDLGLVWDTRRDVAPPRACGTPPFMAPEMSEGLIQPGHEHLVDVYALGMILYSLVAGVPAFGDESPYITMNRQLHESARPLADLHRALPPRLSEIVAALLDRDPARRPQSVAHVRDALVGIPRRVQR